MALYLVHSHWPQITIEQLTVLQRAVQATSAPAAQHLRAERTLCEAPRATLVWDVNELAHRPFMRIVNALDLSLSA